MTPNRAICVFCGASSGTLPSYRDATELVGRTLAEQDIELVYGGGSVGLMGTVADAALAAGGRVTGVIPESLFQAEMGHQGVTKLEVVPDMHARKARMATLAGAFIALPGGIGTFEELFEVWTWSYLGYHDKPVALLNVDGFYDGLLDFLRHAREQGFLRPGCYERLIVDSDPERLVQRLLDTGLGGRRATRLDKI